MKEIMNAGTDAARSNLESIPENSALEDFVVMARPMHLRTKFAASSFNSLLDELDVDEYIEKQDKAPFIVTTMTSGTHRDQYVGG
jgi:hypothetical protein